MLLELIELKKDELSELKKIKNGTNALDDVKYADDMLRRNTGLSYGFTISTKRQRLSHKNYMESHTENQPLLVMSCETGRHLGDSVKMYGIKLKVYMKVYKVLSLLCI